MSQLPLIDAIEKNQKNRLKLLLDLGHNPNGDQNLNRWKWDKNIPLVCAFKHNRWEFAIILLDAGADPNLLLNDMAHKHKKNIRIYEWYKLLFNYGADSNYLGTKLGFRPLHYFAMHNEVELIDFFIDHGADVEAGNSANETPLAVALCSRSTEVARHLIDKGCSLFAENRFNETPLHRAVSSNAYDALCYALSKNIDINYIDTKGRTALFGLAEKDGFDLTSIAELLIDHGARFDYTDHNGTNRLAILLVSNNKPNTLQFLLSKGLNIGDQDTIRKAPILHYSIIQKHYKVAKALIDHKIQINTTDKDGDTPLHLCIENRLTELAEKLIYAGATLNTKNNQKSNALQAAFQARNYEIFEMIFFHPGNTYLPGYKEVKSWMNHFMDYGLGDLFKAILEKYPVLKNHLDVSFLFELVNSKVMRHSVLKTMVESGININVVDEFGMSPLAYSVYRNDIEKALIFIEFGGDVNHRNKYSITPLIEAAKRNYNEMAKLLLDNGANTEIVDWEGKTAHDHARQEKNAEMITLIKQYMPK